MTWTTARILEARGDKFTRILECETPDSSVLSSRFVSTFELLVRSYFLAQTCFYALRFESA